MKIKKGILFITFLFFVIMIVSSFGRVQAATGSLNLNIKMLRNSGFGYQLANGRKNVWKIYEVGGNIDDTIYCLKGGPGFGSSDFVTGKPQETNYTRYFDLKDPNNIPETYKNSLPDVNSQNYKALLWILDNCYVAPKINASSNEKEDAMKNREILIEAAKKYAKENGNPDISSSGSEFDALRDDDIDSVQQLAVWHYTNPTGAYHVDTFEFWINAVKGTDANYGPLSDPGVSEGWQRAAACQALFNYLVQTPKKSDFNYEIENSNSQEKIVKFANTEITTQKENNRIIVGPYKIEEAKDSKYSLEGSITDAAGNTISDIIYLDENQKPVESKTTLKDLVGQNFYISIPENADITKIEFNISGTYFTTKTIYWSVANPGSTDQPVVKVEKVKVPFNDSKVYEKEPEKIFDLSLRKFISSVNGVSPETDRTPQIANSEIEKLKNKTTTTAEKVHTKASLTVKTGDKVIYTIRVYNEGEVAGYAVEVTDHLPSGLKLAENSQINQAYGWKNPSGDGKTIVTGYLADKLLKEFDGQKLDSVDLQIECEVIATENMQSLKNIAEITKHKDKDGNTDVKDRDSTPNNVNTNNYGEKNQEDDDDFENLVLFENGFDLSSRKFITAVQNGENTKTYNRAPVVDVTPLINESGTTAIYNHAKEPIAVSNGSIVTYTIRVYNEGNLDGYVTEITDHLPSQLEFIVNDELNAKYGWEVSADGRTVKTNITSPNTSHSATSDEIYKNRAEGTLLKAFNGTTLDYIDVQIRCKVKENSNNYQKITNIADITGFTDSKGNNIKDRDSEENNVILPNDETLPNYKDTEIEQGDSYIPGQQDDDDFEKLVLQRFDLSLRKFITGVNGEEISNRAPIFNKVSDTEFKYEHPKNPVEVANGNIVIYTLRIFNEGNVAGYAQEVKDNLPEGLEYLPDNELNKEYRWKMYKQDGEETKNVEEAVTIKTDYLSKSQEKAEGANLIKAFDMETMTMPDYKEVRVAFKVTEPNTSDRIVINTAEISEDSDENGNPVEDVDSTPDNNQDGEDDIDIEKIKVKYFDLSLKKWVTEAIVTYGGKTTVTKTGHTGDENPEPPVKVEIRGSRMSKTTVKFKYNIKVTNEGEIAGYAKEVIDYIPEGLKFVQEDNPNWRVEDGKVLTDQLKDTLLQPGESATVEIILTWINGTNNLQEKVNWAEIYKDENEYNSPDIDSTPGNNNKDEDDIDRAPVILSVVTGTIPTYISLSLAVVSILAGGVALIKKFVV